MSIYSMLSSKYGPENARTALIAAALFCGAFVAFSGIDNKHALSTTVPHASAAVTASSAQASNLVSDLVANKPWRRWSEGEITEFLRQSLIICIKKADPKEQRDCHSVVGKITDDWKEHHG